MAGTVAVRAKWVLLHEQEGAQPRLVEDRYVLVEGGRIRAIEPTRPQTDVVLEPMAGLVIPGFINLHAHSLNAPLFRGIIDDLTPLPRAENLIYRLLMPVGQLAMDVLAPEQLEALVEWGLREELVGGTTTVLDMWRPEQEGFFAAARRVGIRAYGAPYIRSRPILGIDDAGEPRFGADEGRRSLDAAVELFRRHDQGPRGRLRVALAPHATDTCSAELLADVAAAAHDLDTAVTVHLGQSRSECAAVEGRHGIGPASLLASVGLATPRTIAAHCLYLDDAQLQTLASGGATVAHCPLTYARAGISVTADRFWRNGVAMGIGTDAYAMDMLAEMRMAGFFSKLATGRSDTATAWSLLDAATRVGADALGRPDLGRIAVGATADLAVFDLSGYHLEPVIDPVKSLVWYANAGDLHSVLVDGEVVHSREQDAAASGLRSSVAEAADAVLAAARSRGIAV